MLKRIQVRFLLGNQVHHSLFVIFVTLILASQIDLGVSQETYDFIIVGSGTSGSILARRLAEDGKFSVLTLESGGLPREGMETPAFAPNFVSNTEVTFSYPSIPQRYASRRSGGVVNIISGRVLGGSSSINYMWYNRGNPKDWNNWAEISHDNSWQYDNMLKYFKKIETYQGEFPSDQHGYEGPIIISRPRYAPGLDYWLEAGKELGYPILDSNGPQKISFAPVEFNKRFGRRESSFTGYLQHVLPSMQNLHIIINTNVTQILFEGINAVGVRYRTRSPNSDVSDEEKVAYASKEIIVCAGAIGSPLLLQRSGLGPKDLLSAAGIPLIRDLPVGMHFQDHVSLPLHLAINNASVVNDEDRDLTEANLRVFNKLGDGPFSNTRGGTGQAFAVSSTARSSGEEKWPDLHICMAHSIQPYLSAYLTSNGSLENDIVQPHEVLMSAAVFLVRPRSRGSVYLNPEDVNGMPLLDVGYFSDANDMQSLLDGVKETVRIFEKTIPYKRLGTRILPVDFPACQNRVFKSDQYWKCYIRHASQAGLHAGGTCRMGSGINDPDAVVDSKLRVIGVAGLRVVDASIMPSLTNANTLAAAFGIAEKGAEMVLNYWNLGII